jgi:hypothetical protein
VLGLDVTVMKVRLLRLTFGIVLALGTATVTAVPALAGLVGVSVTGTLNFPCHPDNPACIPGLNYFDPANRFVPPGAGNASGPVVTVVDPGVEFQYNDTFTAINADFGPNSLAVIELVIQIFPGPPAPATGLNDWSMKFSGLGAGGALTNVVMTSNTFPDLKSGFDADTITMSFPGSDFPTSGSFSAQFAITHAPTAIDEPGTILLLAGAVLAALRSARYRRRG